MYNKYCFLKIKLNDNVSCFIYQFSSYTIILSHSLSYTIIISIPFTLYPSLIFFFIHYHSLHSLHTLPFTHILFHTLSLSAFPFTLYPSLIFFFIHYHYLSHLS